MKKSIDKIENFARFGSVLGLERIEKLLSILGNPQDGLKVIHVAGTNGKGSVCKYIYEVLEENGYKVGLFTSPFVESFYERIQYNGKEILEDDLTKYTDIVLLAAKKLTDAGYESPTEFEIITAVSLLYYSELNADFVILEVGLGGIGDSTNIIKTPVITVITSISYDHMDVLGNTLAEIAYSKAGIIKKEVPLVMNVKEKEASSVIAKEAYKKTSVLYDVSKIKADRQVSKIEGEKFTANILGTIYRDIEILMMGEHQVTNAITALATIEILRKNSIIKIESSALYRGMRKAFQKGRFEIIGESPTYVLDGAHNRDGMEAFVKTLDDVFYKKKVLTVLGLLADKEVEQMLDLASYIGDDFIATAPDNSRKLEPKELESKLILRGKNCIIAGNAKEAMKKVKEIEEKYDVVAFVGSLYLIGEIRRLMRK